MTKREGEGKYFAATSDEGPYYIGPCDTPEAALAEAKEEYADELAEGGEIVLGIGRDVYCTVDGQRVVEDITETLWPELYEDALDGWCDGIPSAAFDELSDNLTEVLHAWLDKHGQEKFWSCIDALKKARTREVGRDA